MPAKLVLGGVAFVHHHRIVATGWGIDEYTSLTRKSSIHPHVRWHYHFSLSSEAVPIESAWQNSSQRTTTMTKLNVLLGGLEYLPSRPPSSI